MDNGIYYDLPERDYHAIDRVSNSYLSRLAECPAAAKVLREDTPQMAFGRALHSYVLDGPEKFKASHIVAPVVDKRTKEGKAAWEAFVKLSEGKALLTQEDYDTIFTMSNAIHAHPVARNLLSEGAREVSVLWTDPFSGLDCKARIDMPVAGLSTLIDLKTTKDASLKGFQRAIMNYGYYRQGAFYLDGINAIEKHDKYDLFAFIAVEKEPPHRVEVYTLSQDFINFGRTEYRMLINLEAKCRGKNEWPHYTNQTVTEIDLPRWAGGEL